MIESLNFVYWLQGYLELSKSPTLAEDQIEIIKDRIALVLEKDTSISCCSSIPYEISCISVDDDVLIH